MPKRSHRAPKESDREVRPPELTLASFLSGSLSSQTSVVSERASSTDQGVVVGTRSASEEEETAKETIGFSVKRTKKGKIPISYENRSKGKKVTVISNVTGDPSILLQELKKKIGAGGIVRGETVEIQGDHQVLVENFLTGHPCLK